jgi:hypothetical protein
MAEADIGNKRLLETKPETWVRWTLGDDSLLRQRNMGEEAEVVLGLLASFVMSPADITYGRSNVQTFERSNVTRDTLFSKQRWQAKDLQTFLATLERFERQAEHL